MQTIGALASGVAHEFNNVLQAILGCIEVARREATTDRGRRFLERATEVARRGGELAGQITAFSRQGPPRPRPTPIDPLVTRVAELLSRLVTEKIEIESRTAAPDATVVADPLQIEQMLFNLGANARDAMPTGGRLTIRTATFMPTRSEAERLGASTDDCYVKIVVEDDGGARDVIPETSAATVSALVRELGGHVGVEHDEGRGTRVELSLPCGPKVSESSLAGSQPLPRLEGTVLLVEDEPLVRMSVRNYLEQLGLDVLEANCADEALQVCALHKGELAALVTDIVMPRMSGPKLAELVRGHCPEIAVVLMSANPEVAVPSDEPGPSAPVLRKPFGLPELAQVLSRLRTSSARTSGQPGGDRPGLDPERG